jgi:hypothetical protein
MRIRRARSCPLGGGGHRHGRAERELLLDRRNWGCAAGFSSLACRRPTRQWQRGIVVVCCC